ncbi:MAG TPA: ABC transporter substrate-binding protein [Dehalococcoidia bacterium]|nr:ABC transporter substrate-binding protein [Dehalococcoidia bacterium]
MFNLIRGGALALSLALVLALTAACGDDGDNGTSTPTVTATAAVQYPLTLTDSKGRSVTLEEAPQAIASLSPAATEILFAIGAGDQVAAVEMFSNYPPEAQSLPRLDAYEPSVEAIAGAQPDLVLVYFDPGNLVDGLERAGLTVVFLEPPNSVDGVLEQIRLLGQATGRPQEADELVATMQQDITDIQEQLVDVEQGPRLFHELDNQLFTVAPDSFVGDLYTILKAQNIAAGTDQAYPQLSQEAIIEANPEVIILADTAGGESVEMVKARPGWGSISAVANNRIYVIDPDIASRPGPRLVDALGTLAQMLYPERFE